MTDSLFNDWAAILSLDDSLPGQPKNKGGMCELTPDNRPKGLIPVNRVKKALTQLTFSAKEDLMF